jgi:hypothetical protein
MKMRRILAVTSLLAVARIDAFAWDPDAGDPYRSITVENQSASHKIVGFRMNNERAMAAGADIGDNFLKPGQVIEPGQKMDLRAQATECAVRIAVTFDDGSGYANRFNVCTRDGTPMNLFFWHGERRK